MAEIQIGNFKRLTILHKALLFGQMIFAAIAVFLVYSGTKIAEIDKETEKVLQVTVIVFAVAAFFLGARIFKRKVQAARESSEALVKKFTAFTLASIIQWALIEGATLFAIVCFLITGNYAFIVLAAVLMVLFVMMAPVRVKVAFLLGLSEDEVSSL